MALAVSIAFRICRPAGHWGKGKNAGMLAPSAPAFPRGKPDIDKLARSTLDSMTGILFDDDSRIVSLHLVKRYATVGQEGANIRIMRQA
jgi:crossover junction endodeoxyribonuclease RusA